MAVKGSTHKMTRVQRDLLNTLLEGHWLAWREVLRVCEYPAGQVAPIMFDLERKHLVTVDMPIDRWKRTVKGTAALKANSVWVD